MTAALLSLACWYLSHQSANYDRLGMTWVGASCTYVVICLETCLELPISRYLISLYRDLMDQFKGSQRLDDHQWNSSAARESSRVIILEWRLNSTGHSAWTSKVRDIFDRQTYVANDWWQLMCSNVLQTWDRRNSMTAPVRNITRSFASDGIKPWPLTGVSSIASRPRLPVYFWCHYMNTWFAVIVQSSFLKSFECLRPHSCIYIAVVMGSIEHIWLSGGKRCCDLRGVW